MPLSPTQELEFGRAFYADILPELDTGYFAAMWHLFTVGHLIAADLDRIAHRHGFSIADLHLMGSLRIERPQALRATDLAMTLHVSNAVLSSRVERLAKTGFLTRTPNPNDRRAFDLSLTDKGRKAVENAIVDIGASAHIVHRFRTMDADDRASLSRLAGELHEKLDRDFVSAPRGDT